MLNPMEINEFRNAALVKLHDLKYIADEVNQWDHTDIKRLYKHWGGDARLSRMKTVDEAITKWAEHFDAVAANRSRQYAPPQTASGQTKQIIELDRAKVEFTIPFGKGFITFGAEASIHTEPDHEQMKEIYASLWSRCLSGYHEMVEHPPTLGSPKITPDYEPEDGERTSQLVFDRIAMEQKGSERYYKVKGGDYAKFGLRVWPEVLAKGGIDPAKLTEAETFVSGVASFLVKADGKPGKVVSIRKDVSL